MRGGYQDYVLDYHPLDVVGWDGYVYPYTFNIADFEPKAGRLHQPPPAHQTFQGQNFVICSFCPRMLDWDPQAIALPYHHSNVQSEEVMYYVDGNYAARKGVDIGAITLHPSGLPHGPQPGAVEKSLGIERTNELAVMCDTFRPLKLTTLARDLDDPSYAYSWYEDPVVRDFTWDRRRAHDPLRPRRRGRGGRRARRARLHAADDRARARRPRRGSRWPPAPCTTCPRGHVDHLAADLLGDGRPATGSSRSAAAA